MTTSQTESQPKVIHGPIERRFEIKIGSIDTSNLIGRIQAALGPFGHLKLSPETPLPQNPETDVDFIINYTSTSDPVFKASVSRYSPQAQRQIRIIGVYVYSGDFGLRDDVYVAIFKSIFNNGSIQQ